MTAAVCRSGASDDVVVVAVVVVALLEALIGTTGVGVLTGATVGKPISC